MQENTAFTFALESRETKFKAHQQAVSDFIADSGNLLVPANDYALSFLIPDGDTTKTMSSYFAE